MKAKNLLIALLLVAPIIGFTQPGSMDATFGDNSGLTYFNFLSNQQEWMTDMVVDDQDRIWVAGRNVQTGDEKVLLARLTPDGQYDTDFGVDGHVVIDIGPNSGMWVKGMSKHNNGLVIVGYTIVEGVMNPFVLRYTLTGVMDFNFGDSGILTIPVQSYVSGVTTDSDGNIYVSATVGIVEPNVAVYKVLPNGELDPSFGFFGGTEADFPSNDESSAISLDEDGNIYVFGDGLLGGVLRGHITSFLPNGMINTNFTGNGRKSVTWPGDKAFGVIDGILSADGSRFYLVGHVNEDGIFNAAATAVDISSNLITDFGVNGYAEYDLTIGGDEGFKRIVEGANGLYIITSTQEFPTFSSTTVVLLDENGVFVNGFGENESGWATFNVANQERDYGTDLAFQSNGKLVLCGILTSLEVGDMGFAMRLLTESDNTSVINQHTTLSAYPNPCRDNFWINDSEHALTGEEYRIFNMQGQVIQNGMIQSSTQRFNVSQLPAGVYQLLIGNEFTSRFIKQ